MKKSWPVLFCALCMAGCSLTPVYERPPLPVRDAWPSEKAEKEAQAVAWQAFFQSPALQEIIQTSLENNRDMRIALLKVEEARAMYRIQRADLVPSVEAGLSSNRQKIPENAVSGMGVGALAGAAGAGALDRSIITSQYEATIGTTAFEMDLFGRLRSLNQQALENYLATEQGSTSARIALIAEVSQAYVTYLADKELLKTAEETERSREESYKLVEKNFKGGIAAKMDVARAKTAWEDARKERHIFTRQAASDKNALVLLIGTDKRTDLLDKESFNDVSIMEKLPVGLPSAVLLKRPDIVQAEHELKAENASIGAARAAFFPAISLTGNAGFASASLSDLFSSGSGGAWTFAPKVTLPLFEGGRNQARLDQANISQKMAVARYEKAIQTAFREVSDGLTARQNDAAIVKAQQAALSSAQEAYDLANAVYKGGMGNYLDVLDAQRSLSAARQNAIRAERDSFLNRIALYKALGGGRS